MQPPELYEFIASQRQSHGVRLLPLTAPRRLRELLGALKRNEIVGLVADRDIGGSGQQVSFFGAPTTFSDGAAALAVRTGAPVLVGVAFRRPDGSFRATIEPPLVVAPGATRREDVSRMTQAIAERLQYHVAQHPEQWTVFQRRWPRSAPRELRTRGRRSIVKVALVSPYDFAYPGGVTEHVAHLAEQFTARPRRAHHGALVG